MSRHITIFFLLCSSYFISCSSQNEQADYFANNQIEDNNWTGLRNCIENLDSIKVDTLRWKPLKLNLYRNKKSGGLYYLTCGEDENYTIQPTFRRVHHDIDVPTFQSIGGVFAADKNAVYQYLTTRHGVQIAIINKAHRESFEVFPNTVYARDKFNVYISSNGVKIIPAADPETFIPIKLDNEGYSPPLARDKHFIFIWDAATRDISDNDSLQKILEREGHIQSRTSFADESIIRVIGVYYLEDYPNVHLIEMEIAAPHSQVDLESYTQAKEGIAHENRQVPYAEVYLNSDGKKVIGDWVHAPEAVTFSTRFTFFFHFLDTNKPLQTSYGQIALPYPKPMPARLDTLINYEAPE